VPRIGELPDLRFPLAATRTADSFFLFNSTQFAFRDVPAFATNRTQNTRIGHALTEATEKLFL